MNWTTIGVEIVRQDLGTSLATVISVEPSVDLSLSCLHACRIWRTLMTVARLQVEESDQALSLQPSMEPCRLIGRLGSLQS